MQLGIESHIPDGLLAANALLAENTRQGVPTSTHALHRGFEFAISSTVLGLEFRCYESASDPVVAPKNGTPGTQVSAACQAQLLGMLNAEHGTNLTDANVTGTYLNGTAGNLLINATGLTAAQFNSFQPGRYSSYGGQFLLGFGLAGHIANEPGVNPGAVFNSSNIGGSLSVSFAFHDDHGYANNPIGALIHFFTDVLGHNSRKQC